MLAQLSGEAADRLERIGVVAPLRKAASAGAHELSEQGPSFDPKEGLERNDVFLTEREVVFLFEAEQVSEAVRQLAADPGLWRAALAWSRLPSRPPAPGGGPLLLESPNR